MAPTDSALSQENEQVRVIADDAVLIVGGGPVGLMTASVLAHYGVRSVILERNQEPTKWPKMDLTNARSMELLRKIGLASSLRSKGKTRGVPSHIPYTVLMSSGLSQTTALARWDLPSVDDYNRIIKSNNDGTQPLEPYLRVPQYTFESWMRDLCEQDQLIDLKYDHKVESIIETAEGTTARVTLTKEGRVCSYQSKYTVACDGASSRCRKNLNIDLDGGPLPFSFLLIHFKSRDLHNLHKQGRFWHLFMFKEGTFGGAVICQDEKETFTIHLPLAPDEDGSSIASEDAIYTVLGGLYQPFPIKVDEVLVRSTFRPSIAVAKSFAGPELRLFLAGDSAHQNIPTGGYGMNTGLGDAFDIAWKLAAVIHGYGGRRLLESYDQERKPIAAQNVHRSGIHMAVHLDAVKLLGKPAAEVDKESDLGFKVRKSIQDHYAEHDGENTDLGIEMGYRYVSPVCIINDSETPPEWDPHSYVPTTWPGSRAPHLFLRDGSPIFDHLGSDFSLVEFIDGHQNNRGSGFLIEASKVLGIPLTYTALTGEPIAAKVWEKSLVLVRPDGHVAWRADVVKDRLEADYIMKTVTGRQP